MHSCNVFILIHFVFSFLSFNYRHRKRIQNHRPSSHKRPKRRRKEEAVAKPKRRSGQKEKFVTSWTIKCCSISQRMRNYTRRFHHTNWSLQVLYPKDWRFVAHLHDVHLSNCVIRVSVWWWRREKSAFSRTYKRWFDMILIFCLFCCFVIYLQDWSSKLFNITLKSSTHEPQRAMIQLRKADILFSVL